MALENSANKAEFNVEVGQLLQAQEAGGRASWCSAQQHISECLLRLKNAVSPKKVWAIGRVRATAKMRADIFMK